MSTAGAALDLSPAAGAAPARRRVLRHARTELTLLVRNGEQLLLAIAIPTGVLVIGAVLPSSSLERLGGIGVLAPSVLALAIWSTTFTSTAIATAFERRYGVLERLASTPLGRTGLVLGKALALMAVVLGQLLVLTGVALGLGWRPSGEPGPWLIAVVALLLSVLCFASWALALAATVRAEATLGLANLIYLLLAGAGGLVLSPENYPGAWSLLAGVLPTASLGESLRNASAGVSDPSHLLVLGVWAVLGLLTARRAWRWTA